MRTFSFTREPSIFSWGVLRSSKSLASHPASRSMRMPSDHSNRSLAAEVIVKTPVITSSDSRRLQKLEGFAGKLLAHSGDFRGKASLQTLENVHKHLVHDVQHLRTVVSQTMREGAEQQTS